jgi:hypothetical protein
MAAFAILAFLCGAVLAFRFTVLVLYPIIAVGATFAVVLGLGAGNSLWTVTLAILTAAMALQLGYVFGLAGRMSLVVARVSARRSRRAAPTLPTQAV